jgi:hypothetical protein
MLSDTRLFHRSDPDFPTTAILQQRLVAAGRVAQARPDTCRHPRDAAGDSDAHVHALTHTCLTKPTASAVEAAPRVAAADSQPLTEGPR